MSTNAFLAALPALLAIAGFVIFRLIGHQDQASEITKDIVAKLRVQSPESAAKVEGLPPRAVAAKLRWDHELRKRVSDQDFQLLSRVSQYEFVKTLVVYALIGVLFVVGVGAFVYVQTRPKPLELSDWHLESVDPEARGLAVDTDDLKLTWKADGPPEDISILLENVQTKRRSPEENVSSAQQYLVFPKDTYRDILATRDRGGVNRVRAVARTSRGVATSNEFPLRVGVNVTAIPIEEENEIWVSALIDNSSIPNYQFQAKLLVWPKHGSAPLSFGDDMKNPKTVFKVGAVKDLNLDSVKIAYFGPDDPRLVRTGLLGR